MTFGNFIYCCPVTRMNVQGTVALGNFEGQRYVAQQCPACSGVHLVDPRNGALPPLSNRGMSGPPGREPKG